MKNKLGLFVAGSAIVGSLLIAGTALAEGPGFEHGGMGGRAPGVFGTVVAVSGNTLTVTSKGFGQNATPTTYTVNAAGATVTKSGNASSLSSVSVGDMVMIQGTVSGTSVTATAVRDGVKGGMGMMPKAPNPSMIQGNGQPVVGGTVTAVTGSTVTITNKSNVTYTVDASHATIDKGNATSSVASIAVGDSVVVQGTVNGSAIIASSVMDSGTHPAPAADAANPADGTPKAHEGGMGGFFGGIGGFFHNLFGFF